MHPQTRALSVVWWLLLAGLAHATPTVDQEHAPPEDGFAAFAVAHNITLVQTFTVGVTGVLTRLEVQVRRGEETVEDLVLLLWSTDEEGLPENLLATVSQPPAATTPNIPAPFVSFDLGAAAVAVSAGDVLAIELTSNAANDPPFQERYEWQYGGQYAGGTAYIREGPALSELPGEDFHFRTYVDVDPGTIPVALDIKPGGAPDTINPKSHGMIPVAILSTEAFDATAVDPATVRFGSQGAPEAHGTGHIEDVNHDGAADLLLHFRTQDTGITCGETFASLTGETFDGDRIEGTVTLKTVGCTN
jgi:hypothetical protein